MPPEVLADLVAAVHLAYVAFAVGGVVLTLAGALLRWRWVRNPVFRLAHLACVLFVAVEAVLGVVCPLTRWEHDLRVEAGQRMWSREGREEDLSFVGRLIHDVLYYDVSQATLNRAYVVFGGLVLLIYLAVRPRALRGARGGGERGTPPEEP